MSRQIQAGSFWLWIGFAGLWYAWCDRREALAWNPPARQSPHASPRLTASTEGNFQVPNQEDADVEGPSLDFWSEDGADESEEEGDPPAHIRDNSFLVDEAFNQQPGEVQHIFNWIQFWDQNADGREREFAWTYTMEIPLGTQKHQFSFTTTMLDFFTQPTGGLAEHQGGVGDTFLNYRYQLLDNDDFLWCAPRFTLIAPTGDARFGLGDGQFGYQWNLPISRYGKRFDFHLNAGLTYIPNVSAFLPNGGRSPRQDLTLCNLGGSVFWKPRTYLHFFFEFLVLGIEEFDDVGFVRNSSDMLANPGVRYAICQFDEVEWVIGASVPIGVTAESPDIGAFAYMSIEHAFRKVSEGGCGP